MQRLKVQVRDANERRVRGVLRKKGSNEADKEKDRLIAELRQTVAELRGEIKALHYVINDQRSMMMNVAARTSYASPTVRVDTEIIDVFTHMTVKQHAALQMLLRGASNAEIGTRLNVTENTAKVHVRAIMKKLGVSTRSQVVMKAAATMDAISDEEYRRLAQLPKSWDRDWSPEDAYRHLIANVWAEEDDAAPDRA